MRWAVGLLALLLAGRALAATDPSASGRWAVGVTTVDLVDVSRVRIIRTEVWYPSVGGGRDATLAREQFPLVVFVHGNCGSRDNYEYLTTHLAAHGFVVASPDIAGWYKGDCHPLPSGTPHPEDPWLDLDYVRAAFHDRTGPLAAFRRMVRGQRTGIGGHSLGGYWSQKALLAQSHFTVAALLAPLPGLVAGEPLPPPRRAVMVLGATEDHTLPYDPYAVGLFDLLTGPAYLVKIVGGSHSGFTDVDAGLTPAALARQQDVVKRYVTALYLRHLAGRRGFARDLTAADAAAFGADVALTVRPLGRAR